MEVKIIDNSKIFKNAKDEAVARALDAIGKTAERHAKERCPVYTGRLRNSITYATGQYNGVGTYSDDQGNTFSDATAKGTPEKETVYIGTNVVYAKYQEVGDFQHNVGAAHFMRDAATTHGDEYKRIAKVNMRNG